MRRLILCALGLCAAHSLLAQAMPQMDADGRAPWTQASPVVAGAVTIVPASWGGEEAAPFGLSELIAWLRDRGVDAALADDRADDPVADATVVHLTRLVFGSRTELIAWQSVSDTEHRVLGWRQASPLDTVALSMDTTHAVPDGPWQPVENAMHLLAADIATSLPRPHVQPAGIPRAAIVIHLIESPAGDQDGNILTGGDASLTLEEDAPIDDPTKSMSIPLEPGDLKALRSLWLHAIVQQGYPARVYVPPDAEMPREARRWLVEIRAKRTAAGYQFRIFGDRRPAGQVTDPWGYTIGPIQPEDLAETVRRLAPRLVAMQLTDRTVTYVSRVARTPVAPVAWTDGRLTLASITWPLPRGAAAVPVVVAVDPRALPALEPRRDDLQEWAIRAAEPLDIRSFPGTPGHLIWTREHASTVDLSTSPPTELSTLKSAVAWRLARSGKQWIWLTREGLHWQQDGGEEATIALPSPALAGPLATADHVLIGDDTGSLRAYRLADRTLAWEVRIEGRLRGPIVALDPATALVATDAGELLAVTTATGAIQWRRQLDDALSTAPLVIADGATIIVATRASTVHMLVASDGKIGQTSPVHEPILHLRSDADSPVRALAMGAHRVSELIGKEGVQTFGIAERLHTDARLTPWLLHVPDFPIPSFSPPQTWTARPVWVVGDVYGFIYAF